VSKQDPKSPSKDEPQAPVLSKEEQRQAMLREQFADLIAEAEQKGHRWQITAAGHLRVDL
jgi:hypothetical protein